MRTVTNYKIKKFMFGSITTKNHWLSFTLIDASKTLPWDPREGLQNHNKVTSIKHIRICTRHNLLARTVSQPPTRPLTYSSVNPLQQRYTWSTFGQIHYTQLTFFPASLLFPTFLLSLLPPPPLIPVPLSLVWPLLHLLPPLPFPLHLPRWTLPLLPLPPFLFLPPLTALPLLPPFLPSLPLPPFSSWVTAYHP